VIPLEAAGVLAAVIAALAIGYRWGRPTRPRDRWPEPRPLAPPLVHVTLSRRDTGPSRRDNSDAARPFEHRNEH
jgi:hypothetical protein